MSEAIQKYLLKLEESLASAKDDLAKKRFNSCANRAYYACYQAAVALSIKHNLTPTSGKEIRKHEAVQSQIATLIKRKKVLPADQRSVLSKLMIVRITADYKPQSISKRKAARVLKTATKFVTLVEKEASK